MSQAVQPDDASSLLEPEADQDAAVSIKTNGDPIRSFARLLTPIADEVRLQFDEDGLSVAAVDPANVALVEATAPPESFRAYTVRDPLTFGLNLSRFRNAVSWARKRGDDGDPVNIDVYQDPARMRTQVVREDQQSLRRQEWFGITPSKIREDPDLPDLDLPLRADPDVKALDDAVRAFDVDTHAYLSRRDKTLVVGSSPNADRRLTEDDEKGTETETFLFPYSVWEASEADEDAVSSLFSLDYLTDIVRSIRASKADHVTLAWGDQYPSELHFEHEDWGFSGQYILAPRIGGDDDE